MSALTVRDLWMLQQAFAAGRTLERLPNTTNYDAWLQWLNSSMFTNRDVMVRDVLAADAPVLEVRR